MDFTTVTELFSLDKTIAASIFEGHEHPWEILPLLKEYIVALGNSLDKEKFDEVSPNVWIAKSATVFPSAYIAGPCIIDENAEVRHCAFIRGSVIVGKSSVVGNSTEVKNSLIFDNVQVPHYNYVGDSVLGYRSHMGAGSITSNVKSDKTLVKVTIDGERVETGMKKFGAMLGDYVEVGCGSVLNPGTVVGKNTNIYPLSSVRGSVAPNSIYKKAGEIAEKQ